MTDSAPRSPDPGTPPVAVTPVAAGHETDSPVGETAPAPFANGAKGTAARTAADRDNARAAVRRTAQTADTGTPVDGEGTSVAPAAASRATTRRERLVERHLALCAKAKQVQDDIAEHDRRERERRRRRHTRAKAILGGIIAGMMRKGDAAAAAILMGALAATRNESDRAVCAEYLDEMRQPPGEAPAQGEAASARGQPAVTTSGPPGALPGASGDG